MLAPCKKTFLFLLFLLDSNLTSCRTANSEFLDAAPMNASVAPYRSCIFGESIAELRTNPLFAASPRADVSKVGRMGDTDGAKRSFHVTEFKHKPSGSFFLAYTTFKDQDDGGITSGWLEAGSSDEVVAEIGDNEIYNCKVDTVNVAAVPERSSNSCAFGDHLGDLDNSKAFAKVGSSREVEGVHSKVTHLPIGSAERFTLQDYRQRKTGTDYSVFTTMVTEPDTKSATGPAGTAGENNETPLLTGTLAGWIELKKTGQVVGEIVAGSIRRCALLVDGSIRGPNEDALLSDCVVDREWDDLNDHGANSQTGDDCQTSNAGEQAVK